MATYSESDETFINPYNFVPLDEKCDKSYSYSDIKKRKDLLTGWMDCSLENLTPIFIPNSSNDNTFHKKAQNNKTIKSYEFFSYEDNSSKTPMKNKLAPSKPVIPGSEIRGVIRSAFETLTCSCLSTIDDEKVLYKRVTTPAKPGRLVFDNGKWKIFPCERFKIKLSKFNNINFTEGEKYCFSTNAKNIVTNIEIFSNELLSKESYTNQGYFHQGETFIKKKYESIFEVIANKTSINIDEKYVINLKENLFLYRNEKININKKSGKHSGYKNLKIKDKDQLSSLNGTLIYYSEHNGNYYLSPSAIGREVFNNKIKDIVGNFSPCNDIKNLCPTCLLFGTVTKEDSVSSRVRFSDAIFEKSNNKLFDDIVILKELSSPKLSATEFYLKKPSLNSHIWNYDYAFNWLEVKNSQNKKEKISVDVANYKPEIRGRKYYWHQKIDKVNGVEENVATDRNVCIRPLSKNNHFKFKVYFNDITKDELDKLIWILNFGESNEHAHKIGMGKPLGLGSIKISIDNIISRKILLEDNSIFYKEEIFPIEITNENDIFKCDKNILDSYKKITNYENSFQSVSYPVNENDNKTYEWFGANKQTPKGTGTNPIINQLLEDIFNPLQKKYKGDLDKGNKNNFNHKKPNYIR